LVDGVQTVNGPFLQFLSSVRDVAGNSLKPNRVDDTTRFTIFIGTGVDYGDAPATYGTLENDSGAGHESVEGFFLGTGVDIDIDGQPSFDADGDDNDGFDDEDGVVFNGALIGGSTTSITVTASQNGFLDAWIDFNRNGDFEFGEQIADSLQLAPGETTFTVGVPGNASEGQSYARFRLSSSGGLGPRGLADDGEVEDYAVPVQSNPWRNSAVPMDVSGDNIISPIDVLLLINNININGSRVLPLPSNGDSPPPFLDVNGDGSLTAVGDVLPVINFLNSNASAEGEFGGTVIAASDAAASVERSLAPGYFTGVVDHRLPLAPTEDSLAPAESSLDVVAQAEQHWPARLADDAVDGGSDEFEELLADLAADVAAEDDPHRELFRIL
jgi:hypothetical protein